MAVYARTRIQQSIVIQKSTKPKFSLKAITIFIIHINQLYNKYKLRCNLLILVYFICDVLVINV